MNQKNDIPEKLQALVNDMITRTDVHKTDCEYIANLLEAAADEVKDIDSLAVFVNSHKGDPALSECTPEVFYNARMKQLDDLEQKVLAEIGRVITKMPAEHHAEVRRAVGHIKRVASDISRSLTLWHKFTTLSGKAPPIPEDTGKAFDRADVLRVADSVRWLQDPSEASRKRESFTPKDLDRMAGSLLSIFKQHGNSWPTDEIVAKELGVKPATFRGWKKDLEHPVGKQYRAITGAYAGGDGIERKRGPHRGKEFHAGQRFRDKLNDDRDDD